MTPRFPDQSPVYGLDASTDPVLAAGPCGTFYLTFVAFTRGGESKIAVARYRDTNDLEGGDTIVYEGMTVIESGNNAEYGYFLDKPDIEVDMLRSGRRRPVRPPRLRHLLHLQRSDQGREGPDQDELRQVRRRRPHLRDHQDQQELRPEPGLGYRRRPATGHARKTTGGGTVYVFWRHFFDPDAIVWTRTQDYGVKWSNPAILTNSPALEPFDQPTISLGQAPLGGSSAVNPGFPELGFRSNGFPTATVAPTLDSGTGELGRHVFVAWQERVGTDSGNPSTFKKPLAKRFATRCHDTNRRRFAELDRLRRRNWN